MARAEFETDHHFDTAWNDEDDAVRVEYRVGAEAALDAALGFLTDNAEAWVVEAGGYVVKGYGPDVSPGRTAGPHYTPADLLAALSDGRDTGEKP